MAKKKAAREPVKKRTPAAPKAASPKPKGAKAATSTRKVAKAPTEPKGLSQREAAKIRKDVKKTETVTTKKAPKKVPTPKENTGKGFFPGNRRKLAKERKQEMKKAAFDALTPAQKNKRTRDNIRKKKNNASKAAGKAGNSAATGTRPSKKAAQATTKNSRGFTKVQKETGVVRGPKTTTTSKKAKGIQKAFKPKSSRTGPAKL
jgi:hypothetical protein